MIYIAKPQNSKDIEQSNMMSFVTLSTALPACRSEIDNADWLRCYSAIVSHVSRNQQVSHNDIVAAGS
jgi:hypothetical protein